VCQNLSDSPWECELCFERFSKDPKARLCKKCYEYGKANADQLIRDSWAWGNDLEQYADTIKKQFLEDLEEMKPIR
jgi:hypothetical protein